MLFSTMDRVGERRVLCRKSFCHGDISVCPQTDTGKESTTGRGESRSWARVKNSKEALQLQRSGHWESKRQVGAGRSGQPNRRRLGRALQAFVKILAFPFPLSEARSHWRV